MDFINLKRQYLEIEEQLKAMTEDIFRNARFIMGKEVKELEEKLAGFIGTKYCISCASGTDALLIPLMAWGIGKGDAVFVPSFTFFASAEAPALLGATPIFVDSDENSYNIDARKLEEAISNVKKEGKLAPKAIIPVDLFGRPADMEKVREIAKRENLLVLEDGCQGFGGNIEGKKACSFGDVAATSFFPAKPLGCYGDGGAIFTDSGEIYEKMLSIRVHGQGSDKYDYVRLGLNGRLDTIQAAVLLCKMNIFENELKERTRVASRYIKNLKGVLETPLMDEKYFSSWAQFTCKAESEEERKRIIEGLKGKDIPTAIYYPIPLHKQTAFSNSKAYCDLHISEELGKRVFSLPMHPYLKDEEIDLISEEIRRIVAK